MVRSTRLRRKCQWMSAGNSGLRCRGADAKSQMRTRREGNIQKRSDVARVPFNVSLRRAVHQLLVKRGGKQDVFFGIESGRFGESVQAVLKHVCRKRRTVGAADAADTKEENQQEDLAKSGQMCKEFWWLTCCCLCSKSVATQVELNAIRKGLLKFCFSFARRCFLFRNVLLAFVKGRLIEIRNWRNLCAMFPVDVSDGVSEVEEIVESIRRVPT